MRRALLASVWVGFAAIGTTGVRAQDTGPAVATDRLNVFLACEGQSCDPDPYR